MRPARARLDPPNGPAGVRLLPHCPSDSAPVLRDGRCDRARGFGGGDEAGVGRRGLRTRSLHAGRIGGDRGSRVHRIASAARPIVPRRRSSPERRTKRMGGPSRGGPGPLGSWKRSGATTGTSPSITLCLRRSTRARNRPDDARRSYQQVLRIDPRNLEAMVRTADLQLGSIFKDMTVFTWMMPPPFSNAP